MEHYVVISAIISIPIMLAAIFVIIIIASTKSRREYKRIKNLAESEGTITNIKHIRANQTEDIDYYVINYSFTDIRGKSYSKSFKNHRLGDFKEGGKITVYYDMDDPYKCVTDYKLKAEKNMWWQALLIAAVIIIIPFVIVFTIND